MKFLHRPNLERIHKQDAWKTSAYAFVPYQTNFGELCGFADDVVQAAQGFGMHPHQNMEITTIMVHGKQQHKDNLGNEGYIDEHSVQTMSAGSGIMHSEFNASATESFHSYQIWVYPKQMNVKPRHEKFSYSSEQKLNRVLLAISPDGRFGSASTNQDAFFSLTELENDRSIEYKMNLPQNGVYIHCTKGKIKIDNFILTNGDALGVYAASAFKIEALENSQLVFVEVPMHRGINV
jgi:redox-sensitive bicupin YhaK (pirin superfamily)